MVPQRRFLDHHLIFRKFKMLLLGMLILERELVLKHPKMSPPATKWVNLPYWRKVCKSLIMVPHFQEIGKKEWCKVSYN